MYRFVFCRWLDLVPLRRIPSHPTSIAAYIRTFGHAGGINLTSKALRTGMVFNRLMTSQLSEGEVNRDDMHIALSGQWSPDATTYKCDYVHPAFFINLFSHTVRFTSSA